MSFQNIFTYLLPMHVTLKPLVFLAGCVIARDGRLEITDTHTQTKYCNPTAYERQGLYFREIIIAYRNS